MHPNLNAEWLALSHEVKHLRAELERAKHHSTARQEAADFYRRMVDKLRAENERLRALLNDEAYIRCKADYNRGHLSHANYLDERERGLGLAIEQSTPQVFVEAKAERDPGWPEKHSGLCGKGGYCPLCGSPP